MRRLQLIPKKLQGGLKGAGSEGFFHLGKVFLVSMHSNLYVCCIISKAPFNNIKEKLDG
jgi:hypothetical protein